MEESKEMDFKDENALVNLLNKKKRKYQTIKWVGFVCLALTSIAQGVFTGLN